MKVENKVLNSQIEKWRTLNPAYYKVIEKFQFIIEIADINQVYCKNTENELIDFIDGLVYRGIGTIFQKNEKYKGYLEKGNLLMNKVYESIIKHAKSESYKNYVVKEQITGNNTFDFNGVKGRIDLEAIKLHAKRMSKHILTRKDVEEIEKDFVRYNRELYSVSTDEIKLSTGLNQVRMKAIHKYLSDKDYIDVDIDSWLYWFSLQSWINKKKKPAKIKWLAAAYHVPNVVYLICGNMQKSTKIAMENSFSLPKGSKYQNMTLTENDPKRDKEPYKSIYNMMEMAERELKDLH